MGEFQDKVVLITGGGTGIGKAAALAFAREGAKVVLGNRNTDRGEAVARTIRDQGGEASFLATDVSEAGQVEALVGHAVSTYGGLDAAFNNAGIEGVVAPLTEQAESDYQRLMDINVKGVWLSMKHEIPRMLERGGGAIVNNASIAGQIGFPGIGLYVATKHAVLGLTKNAALEFSGQGVRVNAVNPAVIETGMADRLSGGVGLSMEELGRMHPIGRVGTADEVAETVLFLCSDRASFVTGQAVVVDGAYTAQ